MSYIVEIQLCDDGSVIKKIETEVENIEQGKILVDILLAAMWEEKTKK